MGKKIILSIVTINFNNRPGLINTLHSISIQDDQSFEHIIIDGKSIDGSLEIIEQYVTNTSKKIKWISEPDSGIYNAMNKGIRLSKGEYLLFLNSGDYLFNSEVISNIQRFLDEKNEIISGELQLVDNGLIKDILKPPFQVDLNYCINAGLTHPNTFIKRSLFDKYGLYNEKNKIISDWEFFLIACGLNTCNYKAVNFIISCFETNGISSTNADLIQQETIKVLNRLLPLNIKLKRKIKGMYKYWVNKLYNNH